MGHEIRKRCHHLRKHHIYVEPYRKDEAAKAMILVNGVLGQTLSYAEAGD
jgi:hypothetical protein